jgi:hypothetical protein
VVAGDAMTSIWHRGALIGGKVADSISEYVDQANSQNYAPHNKRLRHIISVPVTRPSILYIIPHSVFQVFSGQVPLFILSATEFTTFIIQITLIPIEILPEYCTIEQSYREEGVQAKRYPAGNLNVRRRVFDWTSELKQRV